MTDEKDKQTLSDQEVLRKRIQEQMEHNPYYVQPVYLPTQERKKVSLTQVAWGFCLWFIWSIAVIIASGWAVAELVNNLITTSKAEVTLTQGISAVMIVIVLSTATRLVRLGQR